MAVTPVGQNRPQPLPQTEAAKAPAQAQALDQKAGGGGGVAPATRGSFGTVASDYGIKDAQPKAAQQNAFQQELARDTFDAGAADQAQALDGADASQDQDPFSQALDSLVQALNSVVDLVKSILPPETGAGTDPNGGVGQDPQQAVTKDNSPLTRDFLDGLGGGAATGTAPGDPTDPGRTPFGLGPMGPGVQGTQPGAYGVAGINQNDPNLDGDQPGYTQGSTNCGPTAMAEIARGRALEDPNYQLTYKDANGAEQSVRVADLNNEQLVNLMKDIGQTTEDGTSPNGMIDMASVLGEPVTDAEVQYDRNFEPGKPSNSFDQKWLDDKLENGEKVIVNGAYEATDDKGNTGPVGHFMTIAGKNADGTYKVMDPWDGKQKDLTGDEVRRFMEFNKVNGGVMIAVGKTREEQAAADAKAATPQAPQYQPQPPQGTQQVQ